MRVIVAVMIGAMVMMVVAFVAMPMRVIVPVGKVMIVDTEHLDGMYRVGAFFALSLMMAVSAWAYQKLRQALLAADLEKEHVPST